MDKKTKKRIGVLQQKRQTLQKQLAGVRRFPDDPAEEPRLLEQMAELEAELAELKAKT